METKRTMVSKFCKSRGKVSTADGTKEEASAHLEEEGEVLADDPLRNESSGQQ